MLYGCSKHVKKMGHEGTLMEERYLGVGDRPAEMDVLWMTSFCRMCERRGQFCSSSSSQRREGRDGIRDSFVFPSHGLFHFRTRPNWKTKLAVLCLVSFSVHQYERIIGLYAQKKGFICRIDT